MRAVSLHSDVIVATSALLQVNCVLVRGPGDGEREAETFVIDSPVLPEELELLPALAGQARFPPVSGLLATHGDWDHLLGRLAFPQMALGCAESTAARLAAEPGAAQRALREFDEELYIERPQPLSLGSVQPLPVPGRCELGAVELELHATGGHTADGMALLAPWASVLVTGDYLCPIELPMISPGGGVEAYLATLEQLGPLVERAEQIVAGHGHVLDRSAALAVLAEDVAYLHALVRDGEAAELPSRRRTREQRSVHARNLAVI